MNKTSEDCFECDECGAELTAGDEIFVVKGSPDTIVCDEHPLPSESPLWVGQVRNDYTSNNTVELTNETQLR